MLNSKQNEREKMIALAEKKLGKMFLQGRWEWRGGQFIRDETFRIGELPFKLAMIVNFTTIQVTVNASEQYGMAGEIGRFAGDDAIGRCARWTAEKLTELYEAASRRLAPYAEAHELYLKAIKGD